MKYNDIETVFRFNGVIYECKEDAEQAKRCDNIKQTLMSVLDVNYDSTFDEFWNAFIRNERAIELANSIKV